MVYFRGHSKDFDEWEELGNPGWGWKDVKQFFKSAERWTGPTEQSTLARIIDISNYGTSGRYSIMPNPFNYKVIDSWISKSVINSRSNRL